MERRALLGHLIGWISCTLAVAALQTLVYALTH